MVTGAFKTIIALCSLCGEGIGVPHRQLVPAFVYKLLQELVGAAARVEKHDLETARCRIVESGLFERAVRSADIHARRLAVHKAVFAELRDRGRGRD